MFKILLYIVLSVSAIAMLVLIAGRLGLFTGNKPSNIGIVDDRLLECPNKANCVSSYSSNNRYFIKPLPFYHTEKQSIQSIRAVISALPRVTVLIEKPNYLYAECRSQLMGFVDDLEILCDQQSKQCHVRSASRLGHSDFEVNRKRIELIRSRLPEIK